MSTISRGTFASGSIATILGGGLAISLPGVRASAAQTPTDLASLDLPRLDITVTADGFEGMPTELEAGRFHVTVTLAEGVEYGAVTFIQPPSDMTTEEFWSAAFVDQGAAATPEPSPAPGPDASPAAEDEAGSLLPTAYYQATWAGGAVRYAEQEGDWFGQAVVELGSGEWIMGTGDIEVPIPPVFFTVTGEMPAGLPEPDADIDVTFIDFGINVEGNLVAGAHIMRIENKGAQPHFIVLEKGPDVMTNEHISQIIDFFSAGGQGTPPDVGWDPDRDLIPIMDTAYQSIGVVNWVPVALEAGTYAGFCFFPTAGEGLPHAFHGMHTVFTVE